MVILGILVIFGVISVACVQIVFVCLLFAMRLMPGRARQREVAPASS